jgi:antitoxin component YwqK of YwqJK toxin-antitoxin module
MKKGTTPRNDKGKPHGLWKTYYDGNLWFKRFYHNGKEVGYEVIYWNDGKFKKKRYHL